MTSMLSPLAPATPWRRTLARPVSRISLVLWRWARRLERPSRPHPAARMEPMLEFYAEAGAPEGALYLNGDYVGRVDVSRL